MEKRNEITFEQAVEELDKLFGAKFPIAGEGETYRDENNEYHIPKESCGKEEFMTKLFEYFASESADGMETPAENTHWSCVIEEDEDKYYRFLLKRNA